MKITQLSAGRDRSVVLASDGKAYGWGSVKLLGAVLPPGYPGELCTSTATEVGHNRFAQPIAQWLNPGTPFASVADGYIRRSAAPMDVFANLKTINGTAAGSGVCHHICIAMTH